MTIASNVVQLRPMRPHLWTHDRNVSSTTVRLVEQLDQVRSNSVAGRARIVEDHIVRLVNEALELLASSTLEMHIDPTEPQIRGPVTRGDVNAAVAATASLCRRRFAKMCRDHQEEAEDEDEPTLSAGEKNER